MGRRGPSKPTMASCTPGAGAKEVPMHTGWAAGLVVLGATQRPGQCSAPAPWRCSALHRVLEAAVDGTARPRLHPAGEGAGFYASMRPAGPSPTCSWAVAWPGAPRTQWDLCLWRQHWPGERLRAEAIMSSEGRFHFLEWSHCGVALRSTVGI